MTQQEINALLNAIEALGKTDDLAINTYLELAHDKLSMLWAKEERRIRALEQADEDRYHDEAEEAHERAQKTYNDPSKNPSHDWA